ncbi:MAG: NosD domain-containing protein [Armatimonadia bacterium]
MGAGRWVFCRGSLCLWVSLAASAMLLACRTCEACLHVPDGYPTIQAAIDAAADGEVIVVAVGRYRENLDFRGKAITVQSSDPTNHCIASQTVIDGNQQGSVVTLASGETANSVLSGFTITNGSGTCDQEGNRFGGGVLCIGSSPTLTRNIIRGNTAGYNGGGVACHRGASPTLTSNTISGNWAGWDGGGVSCDLRSCPMLSHNTICDNSADDGGGGVSCSSQSSATITDNAINGNSARFGAGVFCWSSSPRVLRNTIRDNSALQEGGGVYCDEYAAPGLANNAISGNSAELGGGVFCYSSSPTLTNDTISGNLGRQAGGGVYCDEASPKIRNTIIALNTGGGGLFVAYEGSHPVVTYCVVWGNKGCDYVNWPDQSGSNGNCSVDPLFADANGGNLRLKSRGGRWDGSAWVSDSVTSPCIDAGDPASAFGNEPAPNGGRINMGFDGNTVYASKSCTQHRPTAPETVTISPDAPGPERLTATATGSTDEDGDSLTYKYQWSKLRPDGTWGTWDYTGRTLAASNLAIRETWRVRAQALDGELGSPWKIGGSVTITNMAGVLPQPKTYGVPVTACVFVSFRWPVRQETVTTRVQLKRGTTAVPAVMTWVTAHRKVKLRPKVELLPDTYYRVNVDSGIVCTDGRVLGWGENYWFKTAPATASTAMSITAAPTAAGAQVTLSLSTAARVRTVVCNIAGRVVAELAERDLPAGVSSLVWNGKGKGGTRVPLGTYLVRVEARGAEGAQATALTAVQLR